MEFELLENGKLATLLCAMFPAVRSLYLRSVLCGEIQTSAIVCILCGTYNPLLVTSVFPLGSLHSNSLVLPPPLMTDSPFDLFWKRMELYSRGSQQVAHGPNPARRPFLVGPLSTLKYYRAVVSILPSDMYFVFGPLWPSIEISWEPLLRAVVFFLLESAWHCGI